MKTNTKILLGFLLIIILIFVQAVITYKLQSVILNNTKQIQNVEAPLELLAAKGAESDAMKTSIMSAVIIFAQKGDYETGKVLKTNYYDTAVDELISSYGNHQVEILVAQSKRTKEQKVKTNELFNRLNENRFKISDLETQVFNAIDKKDLDTAASLITGEEYKKYKVEMIQDDKNWQALERGIASVVYSNIFNKSQQIIYFNSGVSILTIIMIITIILMIRSFVVEQYKKYELLFESSCDAIMTLKPPTWNFTSGNQATFKIFNIKDEKQFVFLTPGDLSPEKQPDGKLSGVKAKEMIEKAMKEGSNFFEWTHKRYEGEDFYATVLLSRVEAKDRAYLQATVRDISDQKKMETNLNIFKNATESSSDAIGMSTPEGKHYYQNKAFNEMFGDIGNDPPGSVFVDKKLGREIFQTIMAGDEWSGEVEMYGKDKKVLNILERAFPIRDNNGKIIGLMGVHTDITEHREMEEKLRKIGSNKKA